MRNYYKILEVDESADLDEIRSAYRRLSKLYHPDINPHYINASNMFKRINEAYAVLSDSRKRSVYDSQIRKSYEKKYTENQERHNAKDMKQKQSDNCSIDPNLSDYSQHDRSQDEVSEIEKNTRYPKPFKILLFIDILLDYSFCSMLNNLIFQAYRRFITTLDGGVG